MLTKTSKKSLSIVFSLVACATLLVLLVQKNIQPESFLEIQKNPSPSLSEVSLLKNKLSVSAELQEQKSVAVETQWPTVMGSPQNAAEVNGWFGERGYDFGAGGRNEYTGYDVNTLEKLAQGGDVIAMKHYGVAVYGTVGGFEKAKKSYFNAAIHGSTNSIEAIGSMIESSIYSNAVTAEEKHSAALEVLAWYNAAALRGDRWPNIISAKDFKLIKHIELSQNDHEKVQSRSQEIYDDLLQKRRAMGLGEFDNSTPDSVNRYLDFLDGK